MSALIRVGDCPTVAWKNGGGTTREIASDPAGAGLDAFAWRLSAARVDRAGPFSHFAGIDRTIAILSGTLKLEVAGREPVVLTPDSAAYAFAGDTAAFGAPLDEPVLDLNLMVRRGAGVGSIDLLPAGPVAIAAATTLLVALRATVLEVGARTLRMEPHDAYRVNSADPIVASAALLRVCVAAR